MILFSSAVYYAEMVYCPDFPATAEGEADWRTYACNPHYPGTPMDEEGKFKYFELAEDGDGDSDGYVGTFTCSLPIRAEHYTEMVTVEEGDAVFADGLGPRFVVKSLGSAVFNSIPAAYWFSLVSITTVGYGDVVPQTGLGKVMGGMAMCTGIMIIALPVGIVGSKFQEAFRKMDQRDPRASPSTPAGRGPADTPASGTAGPTPSSAAGGSDFAGVLPSAAARAADPAAAAP